MKGPKGEDDYFDEPIVGTGMQSGKSVVMQPGQDYEFPDDDAVYESKNPQMQTGALTYTPYSRSQNQYTDSPTPRPVIKPRVGDTVNPNYEKLYTNLALDAGSLLPDAYGGVVFNVASKLSALEDDDYSQGLEFVPGKQASSLSVVNDIYKISQAKPYKYQGKKQFGGSINNISPEGNVDFSLGNKNKLAFNVRGSGNIPNFKLNSINPSLSYNNKGFNADVSPNSFGAGYNNSKVNLNANATVRNNAVQSAGIQGSYNVTPNLSLTGNYNINKGDQGTDKNYFAGFRYAKSFQKGGMSIPGVNGTVIASDNSPRLKKAYMQQAGYFKYVPPSQRPLTFQSSNPSTSDNTRVRNVKYNEPVAPVVTSKKPVTPSKLNPSLINKLAVISDAEERNYSDNTAVYSIPPMNLAQRQKFETEEDYRQSVESGLAGRALNVLPTPLASYIRGLADEDNTTADFTESQKQAAAYAIAKAEARKSKAGDEGYTGSFDYADYPAGYRDEQGIAHNPALSNLFNLPSLDGKTSKRLENVGKYWGSAMMQPTLGKANFKKYNDDEYLIHDRYNFDSYNPNSKSIVDRAEKFANEWGVETETNLTVPVKYVEDARKEIALENAQPKVKQPEEQAKPAVKSTTEKAPAKISKPVGQKSKLQQSYEQVKSSPKKTLTTTTQSKQTAPAKQTSSRNELNSEESNVQNYQRMLNSKYNAGLEADGAWGPKTQAAYEKYIKK